MADPSKTEKATPKRRSEMRNKGQMARSQEFNTAVLFMLAVVFLRFYLEYVFTFLQAQTQQLWTQLPTEMTAASFYNLMVQVMGGVLQILAPFLGALIVGGVVVNIAQNGLNFTTQPLKPDLNRLNPISGFKRIFSLQPLVQLGVNLLKIALFVALAISVLSHHYPVLLQTVEMSLGQTGALLGAVVWELVWKMGGVMLVLSAADVVWQRYNFERNIRMSKQEIKDESKNSEGDPQVKARIRQLQRKAALQRMMEAIPRADVVLTNPTHLAIAIGYDRENMGAPQVLAKGANAVAERIKDKAREAQVPVMENKPLARALFRSTDVGDEIPAELYTAVSEVLIYVYRMSGKLDDYLANSPPPPPGTGPGAEE